MSLRRPVILSLALLLPAAVFADGGRIVVHVQDKTGAAITNASGEFKCGASPTRMAESKQGDMTIDVNRDASCTVQIDAPGFDTKSTLVPPGETEIAVVLSPSSVKQSITITASRSPLAPTDLPITETTRTVSEIALAPQVTVDDKLRQVPGFTLFRRSGSQTANPTTQGVSLRGLGASGASRSLVLEDGVPVNDPFGGWVYWGRIPTQAIQQVDFIEGGASDLYGSNALGGVINLQTHAPTQTAFFGDSSFGSSSSPMGSAGITLSHGAWGASFAGEGFRTQGYVPVDEAERGSIDTVASSRHRTADLLLDHETTNARVFLRGTLFGEDRNNGTQLQFNSATVRQLSAGADWNTALGEFTLRGYGGTENLHQTFSSISADRNTETLTNDQRVPVSQYGFTAQWSKAIASRHILTIGTDGRDVTGDTNELQYVSGKPSANFIAGGRQQSLGIFAEEVFQITPRWILAGSVRGDLWRNIDASSRRFPFTGSPTLNYFANRSESSISPRVGLTRIVNSRFSLHASAYRSFRAPTLNELYRPFRVGNVSTLSNASLLAEHFSGGEFGGVVKASRRVLVRGTAFFGVMDNSVGNITLSTTPTLITRQRQNLGTVRVRGFELQAETRVSRSLNLQAGYQFTSAVITDFVSDPTLIGLRTPQVPRNAFTFAATYDNPRVVTLSLQGRAIGNEFDDDRNQFALEPYFTLGLYISRQLKSGLSIFAASENLTNSRYAIARTPVTSIAEPITARVGIRFQASDLHRKRQ